ncbi:ABC transporter ATP-binding protein [Flavobacterium macacae]|uniref:ABC transporter ATP-binding protein n=1 Tax=Flavobacterium macacae TaxID=2488993 RepID=A0A3P3WBR8_9FLAO|nr:ABC transporter ATP-binding protein [Flavobacterium macacae]RRJ92490.1 ABC transporter ATP-binding protein [Flavobacterium macacae]
MENKIILSAKNLSTGYSSKRGKNIIGSEINLEFKSGNLVALIGANGIGKSTLLRTLTGIQKPISGEVILNQKNINSYSPKELAQELSMVLTENLPPSNLTVFELVALGRQPYTNWIGKLTSEDISIINDALSMTQSSDLATKKHFEISDGQLQKALITRALAQDTPLIVLDEPTTHLDLLHKVSLLKLLKKLASETNKCVLFSTHDLDLALQLSDQIIVMNSEKTVMDFPENLIKNGTLDSLFKDEAIYFDKEKAKFILKND